MDGYWTSHSLYEGPQFTPFSRNFGPPSEVPRYDISQVALVSVVLEDGARFQFDVIRLIVVTKEAGITLHTCNDELASYTTFPLNIHIPKYRHSLTRRRALLARQGVLGPVSDKTCTVFLELLRPESLPGGPQQRPRLVQRASYCPSQQDLQVIYDHTQPCSPAHASMLLFLACSANLEAVLSKTIFRGAVPPGHTAIRAHAFRVLPLATRSKCPELPPHIVRRIAEFAVAHKGRGWRKTLISCGLVSRAWKQVLDIYFQSLGSIPRSAFADNPWVSSVARSLDLRPERGALIRSFSVYDYALRSKVEAQDNYTAQDWDSLLTILGHVDPAGLRVICLPVSVPTSVAGDLSTRFFTLCGVKELHLGESHEGSENASFDMDTIQSWISQWPDLSVLRLDGWSKSGDIDAATAPSTSGQFNLIKLTLSSGTLSASQLRRLTPSSIPRLKILQLVHVDGFSNHDFTLFLRAVASTLEEIFVAECEFSRGSPSEEFALDAAMPTLTALVRLYAFGPGLASSLTLARKPVSYSMLSSRRLMPSITLQPGKDDVLSNELLQAVEVTGWVSIKIHFPASQDVPLDVVRSTKAAALRRGIFDLCDDPAIIFWRFSLQHSPHSQFWNLVASSTFVASHLTVSHELESCKLCQIINLGPQTGDMELHDVLLTIELMEIDRITSAAFTITRRKIPPNEEIKQSLTHLLQSSMGGYSTNFSVSTGLFSPNARIYQLPRTSNSHFALQHWHLEDFRYHYVYDAVRVVQVSVILDGAQAARSQFAAVRLVGVTGDAGLASGLIMRYTWHGDCTIAIMASCRISPIPIVHTDMGKLMKDGMPVLREEVLETAAAAGDTVRVYTIVLAKLCNAQGTHIDATPVRYRFVQRTAADL
ncbi:hypothetical protein DXG01_002983 [Tephrocybe rancida]|nr:hypothetical protein DXG01_002983 [Tephrocybe rancida]